MTLTHILIFTALGLLAALLKGKGRAWLLLVLSILGIYWLQPATPIRSLDFWLPAATLALTVLIWASTRPARAPLARPDWLALGAVGASVMALSLTRHINALCCLTPTRPPQTWQVLVALAFLALLAWLGTKLLSGRGAWLNLAVWGLIAVFIILKTEPLALRASAALRTITGQSTDLATAFDIRWLGFSYIAFRLLHTLRDRLTGRLPELGLRDFLVYIIFFPALSAGPIDRVQRFQKDLEAEFTLAAPQLLEAGQRLVTGIFMKFALADGLALFALSPTNSPQLQSAPWAWVLLYGYAFRIYFDFAGYTHIAIGLGLLFGIRLPENFTQPYRKPNLTQFWNSWHITLAQWFRAYFFNPATRALRAKKLPISLIILIGQLGTMVLIGLWHGVTWNFTLWGLWHGLGLFLHNRWAEFSKTRTLIPNAKLADLLGILLTFHFVALGWVWFALPTPAAALQVFQRLFGGGA